MIADLLQRADAWTREHDNGRRLIHVNVPAGFLGNLIERVDRAEKALHGKHPDFPCTGPVVCRWSVCEYGRANLLREGRL